MDGEEFSESLDAGLPIASPVAVDSVAVASVSGKALEVLSLVSLLTC